MSDLDRLIAVLEARGKQMREWGNANMLEFYQSFATHDWEGAEMLDVAVGLAGKIVGLTLLNLAADLRKEVAP